MAVEPECVGQGRAFPAFFHFRLPARVLAWRAARYGPDTERSDLMSARKKALFKETPTQVRATKADKTTEIAMQIAEKETSDRQTKTEKLRALRLEREAAEAAEKAAAPAPKKKTPAKKKVAVKEPA
jgi:hypothetical protein